MSVFSCCCYIQNVNKIKKKENVKNKHSAKIMREREKTPA